MSNHICPWWLAYAFDNPLRRLFHKPERIFGSYVAQGMTVLDVGCGMGFFSIGLAQLVGSKGWVMAADVQQRMLDTLNKRAEKAGVSDRIHIHRCEPNNLGIETPVDFILAFWMVHEVPDAGMFFLQACSCLKPKGRMLIAEPRFHVSSKRFQELLLLAQKYGLTHSGSPGIRFSWSAILEKNHSGILFFETNQKNSPENSKN